MMWLTESLTVVLAMSFSYFAHGGNACLAASSFRCGQRTTTVDLSKCGITDDDTGDLERCLDNIGRSDITTIRLDINGIGTIEADTFNGLASLQVLSLMINDIATIEAGAFTNLTSLRSLYLNHNALTMVDAGLFDTLGSLRDLWLYDNGIGSIHVDAFQGLVSLESLWLQLNGLTTVKAGLFDSLGSLTKLFLDGNDIVTIEAGAFNALASLQMLSLFNNALTTVDAGIFNNLGSLVFLWMNDNNIVTIDVDAFQGLSSLQILSLSNGALATIEAGVFDNLGSLENLLLSRNEIGTIEAGAFQDLASLISLSLDNNGLTTIEAGLFINMGSLESLLLDANDIGTIEAEAFQGLSSLRTLVLRSNALTTLPIGLFENLGSGSSLSILNLDDNMDLQCVPTVNSPFSGTLPATADVCGCTPAAAVRCDVDVEVCTPGAVGYACVVACTGDDDCDTNNGEVCCPLKKVCEDPGEIDAGACGDPHMTGFRGQKFDFVGEDNGWYAVVSDLPNIHLNMRVTSPVPSVPEITYITGISVVTTDADGLDHTIVISVANPYSLESSCPAGVSPCLAEGALNVVVNGEKVLLAPGEVTVAPDVAIAAVNLPGACRSFGFEKYWEQKKLDLLAQSGRKLRLLNTMQDMSDWVLSDLTATNKVECAEYVANAVAVGGAGMFAKQSEHVSFQIMTPTAKIRLSHGRLHQLPMRDPTDQFDLPDHLTWQMNMAIDYRDMNLDAKGILGETLVPTVDDDGAPILQGMGAIRGTQENYRVEGPLGVIFSQGQRRK